MVQKPIRRILPLFIFLFCQGLFILPCATQEPSPEDSTLFAILTITDMHGKCRDTMQKTYEYLKEQGIAVLSSNTCYDGSDQVHAPGEHPLAPYLVKTIQVGGRPHKIGIPGLGNCDVPRWDLPAHDPLLAFTHPGNESCSMAWEAGLFIPQMKAEGCEFILVSYHGGLGTVQEELSFGYNTQSQGMRFIKEPDFVRDCEAGEVTKLASEPNRQSRDLSS